MKKIKNDNKGFTLVELIVVLVILAILAAILVPALLGYIDEAKNKQLQIHAKSVYTAAQSVSSKYYAKNVKPTDTSKKMGGSVDDDKYFIASVEDLSEIKSFGGEAVIQFATDGARKEWTIATVYYRESDVIAKLDCATGVFSYSTDTGASISWPETGVKINEKTE